MGMDIFKAVAEPNRRIMLDMLTTRERAAGEFERSLPSLTQPAVSRHLRVLRAAGLVDVRARGQQRIYSLRAERLAEVDEWVAKYRLFWDTQLDALTDHLDARHKTARRRRR
jgi:DNA-binding transcriptional ArsR family regulator